MQRVCRFEGEVKRYERDPSCLLGPSEGQCPFCDSGHPLRRHGFYGRWIHLPEEAEPRRIRVLRLLCPFTGRTVSLLPDFCSPRRQYGVGVLGLFLHAWAVKGRTLDGALEAAGLRGRSHGQAQSFLSGFRRQRKQLQAHLSACLPRWRSPPFGPRRDIAASVLTILELGGGIVRSFVRCGRELHRDFGVGLF